MILKRPEGLESWLTGRDYPNDSIAEDGQSLSVTQTPKKKIKKIKTRTCRWTIELELKKAKRDKRDRELKRNNGS